MPVSANIDVARRQVVVVDACVNDYVRLCELVKEEAIRLTITTTGAGGLRLASSFPDALWLVSTRLPDMSGLSLLEMLRSLLPSLTAYVVDATYDDEHERQALRLSAAQYLCKPVQFAWIDAWRGPPSTPAPKVTESYCWPTQNGRRKEIDVVRP